MKKVSFTIVFFLLLLALSIQALGQDTTSQTSIETNPAGAQPPQDAISQASDLTSDDCARYNVKWDSMIYPAVGASYVGGTIPNMPMRADSPLLRMAVLGVRQFRTKGELALTSGCILFSFKAQNASGLTPRPNDNYKILKCSNEVQLSHKGQFCSKADSNPQSYVIAIPYSKINLLSRAKYATSDLASVSTAYVGAAAAILTAMASSIQSTHAKELALGSTAGAMGLYYYFAIVRPRLGDNYIAVFVEPAVPGMTLSRKSNRVTATTDFLHYFRVGQQIEISGVENSELGVDISEISRDATGIVTVKTQKEHGLKVGAQVQIADVTDPSFNGQFQVASVPAGSKTTFTYEQKDKLKAATSAGGKLGDISEISRGEKTGIVTVKTRNEHGLTVGAQVQIVDVADPSFNGQFQVASADSEVTFTYELKDKLKAATSAGGRVQDVWNGTFVVESVDSRSFRYWQPGPDEGLTQRTGTAAVVVPVNTNLTVSGNVALDKTAAPNPKSVDLTGTATVAPPPGKSDELFKKGALLMFRIPNHHDYYNISMTLSAGTALTFVSETAEKTGK